MEIKFYSVRVAASDYTDYKAYVKHYKELAAKLDGSEPFEMAPMDEDKGGNYNRYQYFNCDDIIITTSEEYLNLLEKGIGAELINVITKSLVAGGDFQNVADKSMPVGITENTYNSKCEVHMPGSALSTYNDILLMEDCCSDELQSALLKGWRIIAACPQPDQRRPDYILGRFSPDAPEGGGARRHP